MLPCVITFRNLSLFLKNGQLMDTKLTYGDKMRLDDALKHKP